MFALRNTIRKGMEPTVRRFAAASAAPKNKIVPVRVPPTTISTTGPCLAEYEPRF
jgi:hypothetical protein